MIRAQPWHGMSFSVVVVVSLLVRNPLSAAERTTANADLDRIAYAVDGAESSHGKDLSMWRADPASPQGPMQLSEKAAIDVGGGDRFDIEQNRMMGRAYLGLLHRRYGNWGDAISAYNWGMGRVDGWIKEGRPSAKLLPGVAVYLRRVLRDSGLSGPTPQNRPIFALAKLHVDNVFLPGLEQSGLPLPRLANSGRLLPGMEQSGRLLPGLKQSGRPLQRN
jgi:hypothetical protein